MTSLFFCLLSLTLLSLSHQQQQPPLNAAESESVYLALESIDPSTPWRALYPDDLCLSSPHGVVCGLFPNSTSNDTVFTSHIVELNFGYVLDSSDNPSCSPTATFPPSLSSFPRLRKLFFYRCFTHSPASLPPLKMLSFELEELVFLENPSLTGSLNDTFGNFTSLRRFILTGSNVTGGIPDEIANLPSLEQLTIAGNVNLGKGKKVIENLWRLEELRVLDLSNNGFKGTIPKDLGSLKKLIKLDLSWNCLEGIIPNDLGQLQSLEFLDLGFNKFGNFGLPLFLRDMPKLRELYLSGNHLGGVIPEIWENLGGILGIGLSGVGLIGNIPKSMGVFLTNVSYIGLENNKLEGAVPTEFVTRVGVKLKLKGNSGICLDKSVKWSVDQVNSGLRNLTTCNFTTEIPNAALFVSGGVSLRLCCRLVVLLGVFWSFDLLGW